MPGFNFEVVVLVGFGVEPFEAFRGEDLGVALVEEGLGALGDGFADFYLGVVGVQALGEERCDDFVVLFG